jgi:Xaa-Pro dipeptidase
MTMNSAMTSIVDCETQAGIQAYRLQRIGQRLEAADCAAIVLFDPVNIRYATGTRNMQVWTMHNICRYTVVFADGDTVLFELGSSAHLARAYASDIRPAFSSDFMAVGPRGPEMARRWTESMMSLLREKALRRITASINLPLIVPTLPWCRKASGRACNSSRGSRSWNVPAR